jgi:hypothetical protein
MGHRESRAAAYGIFPMETPLEEVVTSLNSAGFDTVDICVFLSPAHPIAHGVRTMKAASADFAEEIGFLQVVSWLAAFGGVVIPGIGFFVGSREYLQALTHCDCWPEGKGKEALANLGIPPEAAARYESLMHGNGSLVFVICDGSAQSEWAREVMRTMQAEEVCLLGELRGIEEADELALQC